MEVKDSLMQGEWTVWYVDDTEGCRWQWKVCVWGGGG